MNSTVKKRQTSLPMPEVSNKTVNRSQLRILCVDDEASILQALKRTLRPLRHSVDVAEDGASALEMMAQSRYDMVISDMRMPGMSGAEFLKDASKLSPDTYRILLTGYADLNSTIAAINDGHVDKYLQKPWENEALLTTVQEGLEIVSLRHEKKRLNEVIVKQNDELKTLNGTLEQQVNKRTQQIRAALQSLQKEHGITHHLLFNLMCVVPGIDGAFAKRVRRLSRGLALNLGLEQDLQQQIGLAGLLCEMGLVALPDELKSSPVDKLSTAQREAYENQTKWTDMILLPANHLDQVRAVLSNQYKDQKQLSELDVSPEVRTSINILIVARDYWRLVSGKMTGKAMSHSLACGAMREQIGERYDETVLMTLIEVKGLGLSDKGITRLRTAQLNEGMVLTSDLYTNSGMLLLAKGHVFSRTSIEKLENLELEQRFELHLEVAEQQA